MSEDDNSKNGIDVGEFLDFFLLDSQEQVERLGSGLLDLEKEGNNIALINDLFRSAHSLKGASGTMGFTPIVELTHAAEDLLDRLRQGKIDVSMHMIDVLLAVTDRVKAMLAQVERREEITETSDDLVAALKELIAGKASGPAVSGPAEAAGAPVPAAVAFQAAQQDAGKEPAGKNEGTAGSGPVPYDFALAEGEWAQVANARELSHGLYQINVTLAPNTLMKAVRAVMVLQHLENMGTVVKISPAVDEIEGGAYDQFFILLISDEPVDEIKGEILQISEIAAVEICAYSGRKPETAAGQAAPAAAASAAEQRKVPASSPALKGEAASKPAAAAKAEGPSAQAPKPVAGGGKGNGGNGNSGETHQVHYIRVDTARMDSLINMVGEMVITRTRLVQISQDLKKEYTNDAMVNNLNETNVYLGRLMNDLQESVMRLRMVPIGTVFSRFPRLIRDLSRKTGKEVELVLKGEDTELDKTVTEVIGDPLMHLIRNSVDHGIELPEERLAAGKPEKGTVTLDAYHEGNHIAILISDDGHGLDLPKIRAKGIAKGLISEKDDLSEREIANLIFLPGFSTADKVTDISGRGVGMDVVKKALSSLGGMVDISTRLGVGTTFTIRLPLTLAIIQALLVEVGTEVYAVPLSSVLETLLVKRDEIKMVGNLPMVQLRGNTLPLISLQEKFKLPAPETKSEEAFVVVVGLGDKALGLVVDELRGQQEIVIKSLGELLNNLPGIAGATILGDGQVTLILDIGSLIQDVMVNTKL